MNRVNRVILSFIVVGLASFLGFAQNPIPNPGFENWSGGNPVDWWTNNFITLIPVTQSSDAHSGTSSARMEVLNGGGFPYPASLYSGSNTLGFPCTQRHAFITGYYKFIPQSGTDVFSIYALVMQNGNAIGTGGESITAAASNWTQFNVPITYFAPGNPDTCRVDFILGSETTIGALAYVDDLQFSGVDDIKVIDNGQFPNQYVLKQNYPNPFNPTTNIEFSTPQPSDVKLVVYNQLGQTVATLVNERLSAGSYSVDWNAVDMPSGVYYYRISTGDFTQTRKLLLTK